MVVFANSAEQQVRKNKQTYNLIVTTANLRTFWYS